MKYKNVFYFTHINKIGGVESFYWYLAQKYADWDIVIVYRTGDETQIKRLRQYVRVVKFVGQRIECEKAFFNYTLDIIDYVDADEYYQLIHGDYKGFKIQPNTHPKIDKYLGVSQQVCDTFQEITGLPIERIYNPVEVEKPKKMLNLISATRLTKEKGKDRMIKFAKILEAADIPYIWTIYTDDKQAINNPNIIYQTPRLDILKYIANADYLVQLSDHEGYCYSVVESLLVGTPVIVTDCPVFREIGVVNGKNGFVLNFDMTKVPIDEIYKGLPEFEYKPKKDNWGDFLAKGKSQYKDDLNKMVEIKVIKEYYDMQLNRLCKVGDTIKVNKVRAEYIIENGFAKWGD